MVSKKMGLLWRAVILVTVAAMMVVGGVAGAGAAGAAVGRVTFTGTATVTVDVFDYCSADGSPRYVGTQSFSSPTTLVVTDPPSGDPNPISINVATDQQGSDGQFGVTSVYPTNGLTLVYWSLAYDSGSGATSGTLTDNHVSEAAATNLLFGSTPLIPCRDLGSLPNAFAMANGSTLSGTITTTQAELTITGSSTDGLRAFRVDLALSAA